jgi:hypothetical protein
MSHHRHSPHRLPTGSSRRSSLLALAACSALAFSSDAFAAKLAGWDFSGYSGYGASPQAPTSTGAGVTVGGLTRGSGVTTAPTAAANAWGGNGWNGPANLVDAIAAGDFATFTITAAGQEIAIESIDAYNIRRSSSGPTTGQWQYSIDGGAFVDIGSAITWGGTTSATGNLQASIDLTGIPALQSVADGSTVTFRVSNWGATTSGGTWYLNNFQTGDDFVVNGSLATGDVVPPAISVLAPADGATDFDATGYSQLGMTFNEPITLGTGNILVKRLADDSIAYTLDVTDFDQVDLNGAVLGLFLPTPLADNTAYYVEIPGTAITDQAAIPNAFAGFGRNDNGTPGDPLDDTFVWNFTTAPAPAAPTVAVNKYLNTATATTELVELLAIGNGTPGTTVDLRGMIVKDFTTNMTADGGGKFEFTDDTLWDDLPVGTLVVLSNNSTSSDTDPADFVVRVGLQDPVYFENPSGSWEISNTDMVMIKAAGSGASGTTGGIHALGGGAAGSLFSLFPGAKVLASTGTNGVIATNPTATVADFTEGTGATGGVALAPADFGTWNNATNRAYILGLRGINPGEGDGIATISNDTASSPFLGSTVFGKGLTGQTAKITVNSTNSAITLTDVVVTVPAGFGVPSSVTLSGAGGTVASFTVAGQVITIQTAAATNTDPLVVTIDALDSPNPGLLTDDGTYEFGISTSSAGGVPSTIADPPVARVPVPIEALRDVTAAGVPLDLGDIVAVEGVVTESDFGDGTANFSGFLQDATAGISIFSSVNNPALVEGNRFVVLGTVSQSNGLTRIVPSAISNMVFNLGADTPPAPEVLTLATLLADPEAYEGSLVTVQNLTYVSGTWAPANTVVLKNSTPTNIDVRIQAGSTVSGAPGSPTPFAAINVTGVFGQFDGSNPFTSGYQIMPRRQSDLTEGTVSDFDLWAAATGATGGMTGDSDFDGRDNAFEYAFGLNPTSGGSVNPFVVPFNPATGLFTYTRRTQSLTGLAYTYQYSTTLSAPWTNFTPAVTPVTNNGDPVEQITVTVPAALLTEPKLFIRVVTP